MSGPTPHSACHLSAGVLRLREWIEGTSQEKEKEKKERKKETEEVADESLRDGKFVQQQPVSLHGVQPR